MNLARIIVRRRGWIALAWVVAAAALLPAARQAADVLDVSARVAGSESAAVEQLLSGPLASAYARYVVLVIGGVPSPATPAGAAVLREIADSLRHARQIAAGGIFSYLDQPDTLFLAPRGRGTFVLVGLAADSVAPDRLIPPLRALTESLAPRLRERFPDLTLRWTGETALNVDLRRTSSVDVGAAERRALPLTAVFLLVAFGAVAASAVPVVAGALAIALALGAAVLLARVWPLSILLQSVVTMLGLGLGIDYALLTVSRFREGRDAAESSELAAEQAARHAGHTILLSATAVAIGFVVLVTVRLNEIRAIAVGGLVVVVTSGLLAATLLPGVLAWAGAKIDWGRLRRRVPARASGGRWRRLGRLVTAHPWTALGFGALPLVLLAAQAMRLRTGLPRGDWLPPAMESARALADLRAMGRSNVVQTIRVVLVLPEGSSVRRPEGWNALARMADSLGADRRVERIRSVVGIARSAGLGRALTFLPARVKQGLVSSDGRFALLELLPKESVGAEEVVAYVRELRRRGAAASGVAGARLLVGGLPAFNTDYSDASAGHLPQVVALVIAGTLLTLFAGTRSILIPVKAVLLNLLSVAAAFGALTLVFQEGHGLGLFGITEPLGAVFSSLPVIVFCIVFGLSMDYEVFLVTRVMEARRSGMSDGDAIVEALGTTGQVITSAAAIMLVVFGAFTLGSFQFTKMLGFTLAVAVLLDATLVRMVVGPALLRLAGRWNWWPGRVVAVPGEIRLSAGPGDHSRSTRDAS
jgi:putative drug exporter of the RND superfamily